MVQIKALMKKSVVTVDPAKTISDVARIMANNRIGSVVILRGGKPVGIVTREDIVKVVAHGKDVKKVKVSDLKQSNFVTAKPTDDLLSVVRLMVKEGVKRVPVIDNGKLAGILTDKEVLIAAPEMIEVLSEKLRGRVDEVSEPSETIPGLCENCGDFSEDLRHTQGRWYCEDCRNDEGEEEDDEANL